MWWFISSIITAKFKILAVCSIEAIKSKNASVFSMGGRKIQSLLSLISVEMAVLTKVFELYFVVVFYQF